MINVVGKGITDIGSKRKKNQDRFLADNEHKVYVVADGMGGHKGGEVASQLVVDTFQKMIQNSEVNSSFLPRSIKEANLEIFKKSKSDKKVQGMGTTVSALMVQDQKCYFAHVGDSRIYMISGDNMWQITEDHSLVSESEKMGYPQTEEMKLYKNIVTRALGFHSDVDVDIYSKEITPKDRFLICSDGLTNMVSDQKITEIVNKYDIETALQKLIEYAIEKGGDDNITAILIECSK